MTDKISNEQLEKLQREAGLPNRPTRLTFEARHAVYDTPVLDGLMHYNWTDKPHRVVHELCTALEAQEVELRAYRTASNPLREVLEKFPGVTVKPLEWEQVSGDGVETHEAVCPFGIYRVFADEDSVSGLMWVELAAKRDHFCTTHAVEIDKAVDLDDGFAFAQADYERRILSALEMPAGIEAAKQRIAEIGPGSSLIDNMSDEEFAADRSGENPNAGTPAPVSEITEVLSVLEWLCKQMEDEQEAGTSGFEDWIIPARAALTAAMGGE